MAQNAEKAVHEEGMSKVGAKKPYSSPRLVEYGSVAKLTLSGSGPSADGINTMMTAACL